MAFSSPLGSPLPPGMGMKVPLRCTPCCEPSVAFSGTCALSSCLMASPKAACTTGLCWSSVFGVSSGSPALKQTLNTAGQSGTPVLDDSVVLATVLSQKRRNSSPPREPTLSLRSQSFSTVQASPTATGGPEEVGARPPGSDSH